MLMWLQLSLQTLVALTVLYMLLPSTLSMPLFSNLNALEKLEDGSDQSSGMTPPYQKRQSSGADPWAICPRDMSRVSCFYRYLDIYARLRNSLRQSDFNRNIGKRSGYVSAEAHNLCPEGTSSDLCSLIRLGAFMDGLERALEDTEANVETR